LLPASAANIKANAYLPVSNLVWGDDKRVIVAGAGTVRPAVSPPFLRASDRPASLLQFTVK